MAEVKIATRSSSQVEEAYYDADEQKMRVVFKTNGAVYLYNNVDQDTADSMADTPWNVMKGELYDYVRIS